MAKQNFTKPFTTHDEQLDILQKRGLIIADRKGAGAFLSYCNYYRFSGYVLPFEISSGMSDISELIAETVIRVRGVFMPGTFEPKVTITLKTIALNP